MEVCSWPGIRLFRALRFYCSGLKIPSNLEIVNPESEDHLRRLLSSTEEEEEIQEAFEVFPERGRSRLPEIVTSDTFQRLRELLGTRLLVIAPERTLREFDRYEVDRFREGLALSDRPVVLEQLLELWRSSEFDSTLERKVFRHLRYLMHPKLLLDELRDCGEKRLERIADMAPDYFEDFLRKRLQTSTWPEELRAEQYWSHWTGPAIRIRVFPWRWAVCWQRPVKPNWT